MYNINHCLAQITKNNSTNPKKNLFVKYAKINKKYSKDNYLTLISN